LVDFWINYLINHFLGLIVSKKGVFRILNPTSIICTITPIIFQGNIFSLHAMTFGSFFPNLRDLDTRLGGCRIRGIDYLFFEYIQKASKEDSRLM
jgi:hypothetical protein